MPATLLQRPSFFGGLSLKRQPVREGDDTDRAAWLAPCGCAVHRRYIRAGRLSGWSGDVRCEVCDAHCQWCASCGEQLWPHDDCRCDDTPAGETDR
jgi:hypothetical protein